MNRIFLVCCIISLAAAHSYGQAELDSLILEPLPAAAATEQNGDLRAQLSGAVAEVLTERHWAPAYFQIGLGAGLRGDYMFTSPAETVLILSMTLPYLDNAQKAETIAYLRQVIADYPPTVTASFDRPHERMAVPPTWNDIVTEAPTSAVDPFHAGARREWYPLPDSMLQKPPNVWPPQRVGLEVVYALWLFAHNSGDERFMGHCWPAASNLYWHYKGSKEKRTGTQPRLPMISGLIGFARLAQATGHEALAEEATREAAALLRQVQWKALLQQDIRTFRSGHNWCVPFFITDLNAAQSGVYALHPPREIMRFLGQTQGDAIADYIYSIFLRQPLWHLTRGFNALSFGGTNGEGSGENSHHTPDVAAALFFMKAYGLNADEQELRDLLDFPAVKADLFHILKLIALIEAPAAP